MSKLVIVESPAKAKTIQKYLGKGYEVMASMGHIRDLPKSKLGVDIENGFVPNYQNMKEKKDLIASLKKEAKKSEKVYLATDPDREGEAISWHLATILDMPLEEENRVTFNEITKSGVLGGMKHPRKIDQDLVNAQQARRVLDRIVGYKLSPFLWKKIRGRLSAGRVQSVAVRLICDREDEIRAFQSEEYWSLDAKLQAKGERKAFAAKLAQVDGKKVKLTNEKQANEILEMVRSADFTVSDVKQSVRRKNPAPPFTTSTLQQEASRKLGFQARRTMKAAQELYEGMEIPGYGAMGLITYMRTDSLRISDEAYEAAKEYISEKYSKNYLPASRRVYKSKAGAQDGHEAIRPTVPGLEPEQVKASLTTDQFKLYKLIWERFIASQMANALLDTVAVDIKAANTDWKANGFTVKFDGFTVLYEEGRDDPEEGNQVLPSLTEGQALGVKEILANQHFTQPPARYTEAMLIRALEENGIGRPSTYAPTISTILTRNYIERDGKALKPTKLGETITQLLKKEFPDIVNVAFTAGMESDLDKVETGDVDWVEMMRRFYGGFEENLKRAEENMAGTRMKVPDEETDEICEICGRKMVIKTGRFGKFLACSGFPECRNTRRLVQETAGQCPVCGGKIVVKHSKRGRTFYGCSNYPTCHFMVWDPPTAEKCPKCGSTLFKKTSKTGSKLYCAKEGCSFEKGLDE